MKKALIVTQSDFSNYGNRFQNIALSEFLKSEFGLDVFILSPIVGLSLKNHLGFLKGKVVRLFTDSKFDRNKRFAFSLFNSLEQRDNSLLLWPTWLVRRLADRKKYDYVVLGSDQVISCKFGLPDCIASLDLYPNSKKIAYGISTGGFYSAGTKFRAFEKAVSSFSIVSAREAGDIPLLNRLCNKETIVVPDPVFLLDSSEWLDLVMPHVSEQAFKAAQEPFAFVYWLGKDEPLAKSEIEKRCGAFGLKQIWARTDNVSKGPGWLDMSPFDFIYLLSKSKMVFSKSFHGTALAILFHKEFRSFDDVFERTGRHDQRLQQLVESFEIPAGMMEFYRGSDKAIDWEQVDKNRKHQKNVAIEFFKVLFSNSY